MWSLIATIGSFFPGLLGFKIPFKAAKIAGLAVIAVGLVIVFQLAVAAYNASVIATHDAQISADSANAQVEADRTADELQVNRIIEFENTQAELERATREAEAKDPVGANIAAGPVTSSYFDSLPTEQRKTR